MYSTMEPCKSLEKNMVSGEWVILGFPRPVYNYNNMD